MNNRQPTLAEVLRPRYFQPNSQRAAATRTVLQPDIDKFEQAQAADESAAVPQPPAKDAWWFPQRGQAAGRA